VPNRLKLTLSRVELGNPMTNVLDRSVRARTVVCARQNRARLLGLRNEQASREFEQLVAHRAATGH
jgi:hypothetical protein